MCNMTEQRGSQGYRLEDQRAESNVANPEAGRKANEFQQRLKRGLRDTPQFIAAFKAKHSEFSGDNPFEYDSFEVGYQIGSDKIEVHYSNSEFHEPGYNPSDVSSELLLTTKDTTKPKKGQHKLHEYV